MQVALSELDLSLTAGYKDDDTLAAMTSRGAWEHLHSGPIRTTTAGASVSVNDTADRAQLDLTTNTTVEDVLQDGTDQVKGLLLYVKPNGTSADSSYIPVAFFLLATPFYGNGSDVLFTWDSTGAIHLT